MGYINTKKATLAGILIAIGIVFGDIGTSPLYTMNALTRGKVITELLITGGVSCIIWTLILQTTIKYVILTLRADNNGEGGIFSLYALVRRRKKWLVFFAMFGGAMLLSDGLITPPITVTSAMEGLGQDQNLTILFTLIIISGIFFLQQFGTRQIGRLFGPVMILWFGTLLFIGLFHLHEYYSILKAFNPLYAIRFLTHYPDAFWLLSAIFLCTTGAEALYSDLGHCGRANIRAAWAFVKIALVGNYIGQGAFLLNHFRGQQLPEDFNIFFRLFPEDFRIYGIVLATLAAIIASQALISGTFTLVSEGIKLNLLPKLKINYPSEERGQLFIPKVNLFLWIGCCLVVLYFRKSSSMEGAYGLAITLTVLITTFLLGAYMHLKRIRMVWIILFMLVYLTIEGAFLVANLSKFSHGGYVSLLIGGIIFIVMFTWYKARKIKNRYVEFVRLEDHLDIILDINKDGSIPKYATHLVYLTSADSKKDIEHKVIFSIQNNIPKRADVYWIVHVDTLDIPYLREYEITTIIPDKVIRIDFRLGFRENPRVQAMFKQVLSEMQVTREADVYSRYPSLKSKGMIGDFEFIVVEKFLSHDHKLGFMDQLIMKGYFILKQVSLSEDKAFGLNINNVVVEKVPISTSPVPLKLHRRKKTKNQ